MSTVLFCYIVFFPCFGFCILLVFSVCFHLWVCLLVSLLPFFGLLFLFFLFFLPFPFCECEYASFFVCSYLLNVAFTIHLGYKTFCLFTFCLSILFLFVCCLIFFYLSFFFSPVLCGLWSLGARVRGWD